MLSKCEGESGTAPRLTAGALGALYLPAAACGSGWWGRGEVSADAQEPGLAEGDVFYLRESPARHTHGGQQGFIPNSSRVFFLMLTSFMT